MSLGPASDIQQVAARRFLGGLPPMPLLGSDIGR